MSKFTDLLPGQRFRFLDRTRSEINAVAIRGAKGLFHKRWDAFPVDPPQQTGGEFNLLWMDIDTYTLYIFTPLDEWELV